MIYKQLLPWVDDEVMEFVKFECTESFKKKIYSGQLLSGEKIPKIYIRDSSKRPPDFLSGLGSALPIVSSKVKTVLETARPLQHFEFIEPVLINYNGAEQYYILNILDIIDAFDWENSDFDVFDEPGPLGSKVIRKVRKLVVKETVAVGKDLFYIKEFPGTIYISETLEREFKGAGIGDFRTLSI